MSRPLKTLLIEDTEDDAARVLRELRRGGFEPQMARVDSLEALRGALTGGTWDVVISDWNLPSFDVREAMVEVARAASDTPLIIVSGSVTEEQAVEALRAGARDFVVKDRLARLVPAIERELAEKSSRASRRRAEVALRSSEARFNRLAESGIVGIATADVAGNVLDANDAFLAMVGHTREDLAAGRLTWRSLTPTEQLAADGSAWQQLTTTGAAKPWEKELLRRDGSRVPVLTGVAMFDAQTCIAFAVDLTERRKAEEQLQRSQEQLRQAQKMEAIGSLAAGIAHDFNNLLTVILSYSSVAGASLPENDPLREDFRLIHDAGERAAMLTRQLLAFSRQQVLQPQVLAIDAALGRMEKLLKRLIGETIELRLSAGAGGARVRVDPGQLEQVVMNLVVNARDAMPSGGRLTLETHAVNLDAAGAAEVPGSKPGPHVQLTITDTGTGMSPETLRRIYEPFFTTKAKGKGTGLGLSTVLGIVQQSDAAIRVDSALGRGTRFTLYFPVVEGASEAIAAAAGRAPTRGTETVLLVEDHAPVRELLRTVLERHGYEVLEAQSAGDALVVAEQHAGRIHLLLTDVVMPRMGGRQLAERLRALRPDLRVLYMSGYTDDEVLRHGVLTSKVPFVAKPLEPAALLAKVRETLDAPAP